MRLLFTIAFVMSFMCSHAQAVSKKNVATYKIDGYQIKYPVSWRLDTSGAMGTKLVIFAPLKAATDSFPENINIIIQDLKGQNLDLDKYTQISEDQIKEMATDGKISESTNIHTANGEYHKIVFSATQGVLKLKFEQYYFIKNEAAYIITFTTNADDFEQSRPAGEEILNSFTFTE